MNNISEIRKTTNMVRLNDDFWIPLKIQVNFIRIVGFARLVKNNSRQNVFLKHSAPILTETGSRHWRREGVWRK